jgi:hypothetical protein
LPVAKASAAPSGCRPCQLEPLDRPALRARVRMPSSVTPSPFG